MDRLQTRISGEPEGLRSNPPLSLSTIAEPHGDA